MKKKKPTMAKKNLILILLHTKNNGENYNYTIIYISDFKMIETNKTKPNLKNI